MKQTKNNNVKPVEWFNKNNAISLHMKHSQIHSWLHYLMTTKMTLARCHSIAGIQLPVEFSLCHSFRFHFVRCKIRHCPIKSGFAIIIKTRSISQAFKAFLKFNFFLRIWLCRWMTCGNQLQSAQTEYTPMFSNNLASNHFDIGGCHLSLNWSKTRVPNLLIVYSPPRRFAHAIFAPAFRKMTNRQA